MAGVGVCSWSYAPPTDEAEAAHIALHDHVPRGRGHAAWGYVQYKITQAWELAQPLPVVHVCVHYRDPVAASILWDSCCDHGVKGPGCTVRDVWEVFGDLPMACMMLRRALLEPIFVGANVLAHSVRLGTRLEVGLTVPDLPPAAAIKSWRFQEGVRRAPRIARRGQADARSYEDILLALPPKRNQPDDAAVPVVKRRRGRKYEDYDPIMVINACGFSRFLRSTRDFGPALQAANRYEHPDDTDSERDASKDPGRWTLDDAN